jgi:hypothetical protein
MTMTDIEIHGPNTSAVMHLTGYAVAGMLTRGRFRWSDSDTLVVSTTDTPDVAAATIGRYVREAVQTRGWLGLGAKYDPGKSGRPAVPVGSKDAHTFLSPFLSKSGEAVRRFEMTASQFAAYESRVTDELRKGLAPAPSVSAEGVKGKTNDKNRALLPDDGTGLNWTHRYRKRDIAAARTHGDAFLHDVIRGLGKPCYWGNKSDPSSGPSSGATQYIQFLELSGVDPIVQNILIPAAKADVVGMSDAEIMESLCRGTEPGGGAGANTSCDFDVIAVCAVRTVLAFHSLAFVPITHRRYRKSVSGGALNRPESERVRDTTHIRLPVFSVPMSPHRVFSLLSDPRWNTLDIEHHDWLSEQKVLGWCEFPLAVTSTTNNSYGRFSGGKFTAVGAAAR